MPIKFSATVELKVNNQPERFQLAFNVCYNPDCNCNGVNMVLYNENKEIHLFLDFQTESYREKNYSEEEVKILTELIHFLKSEENSSLNLKFFKENYLHVKEKVKSKKEAVDSFELGTLMLYRDILWAEADPELKIDGRNYLIFDSYCVSPNCNCQEVALNFFADVHVLGERAAEFSFVYNYNNRESREPDGISSAQAESIIGFIPPSLNQKFGKRHEKLKKEVKEDVERKIKEKGISLEKPEHRKLGRNEPCHCCSGEKYKKCCLDKDITEFGKVVKVSYL